MLELKKKIHGKHKAKERTHQNIQGDRQYEIEQKRTENEQKIPELCGLFILY